MLMAKGNATRFTVVDGDDGYIVTPPQSYAILHDPSGKKWPQCSVIIMPFSTRGSREATDAEMSGAPKDYFGKKYLGLVAPTPALPPRDVGSWKVVGDVTKIEYVRNGIKHPGGFFHPFNVRRMIFLWTRGKTPVLRKFRRLFRLDLGSGCILDDRGFVKP